MPAMEEEEEEDKPYVPPLTDRYFTEEMVNKYVPLRESMARVKETNGEDEDAWEEFSLHYNKFHNFEVWSNWDGNKYDIVFYGVSGYTGYLMMEYLKRIALKINPESFTFAFAGRTVAKVQEMRDREFAGTEWEDTPILQAGFDDIHSMIDLAKSAHVVINVAGPYMLTEGEVLIDSCINLGAHYVDISGEIPWSLRVMELHKTAMASGVYIIPSAASAGGFPDMGVYMMAKKLREDYGEYIRHAICYCSGGGATAGSSGGTLKTRAAMSGAGDEIRKKMGDPFALGGFIPEYDRWGFKSINIEFGTGKCTAKTRSEDFDANMSKLSEDKKRGVWRGPFVYSYFDTRVVRRSNMLFADLGNCPYGMELNFLEFAMLPPEAVMAMKAGAGSMSAQSSVEAEKAKLESEGKYYKEGEGPSLDDLDDAWTGYFLVAETATGQETKISFIGRDGYFETARVAVETAMCLRFDQEELPFNGGVLTPTVAAGSFLMKRLMTSGLNVKMGDWFEYSDCGPPPLP